SIDNLALVFKDDLISFDKNSPTHQTAQSSMPAVDLLTGDILEADPEAGSESNISKPSNSEPQVYYFLDLDIEVPWLILFPENEEHHEFIDTKEHKLEAGIIEEANSKYIKGSPNVILTKKMKPGFWVEIDKKFLVREVSRQSEVKKLDSNAVVYRLYQIQVPDINRLMPIKDEALNCIAQ
ncbi:19664_t:CDS:2, partial [Cetraspora pellucida]